MALAFMNNTHINIKKANKATKHDFILSRPVHISLAPFHFMTIISSYSKVTFSQTCTLSLSTQLLQPPYLWWEYWCVWIYSAVQFYTICNTQRARWMQVRLTQWYCMQRWKGEGISVSCSSGTTPCRVMISSSLSNDDISK